MIRLWRGLADNARFVAERPTTLHTDNGDWHFKICCARTVLEWQRGEIIDPPESHMTPLPNHASRCTRAQAGQAGTHGTGDSFPSLSGPGAIGGKQLPTVMGRRLPDAISGLQSGSIKNCSALAVLVVTNGAGTSGHIQRGPFRIIHAAIARRC